MAASPYYASSSATYSHMPAEGMNGAAVRYPLPAAIDARGAMMSGGRAKKVRSGEWRRREEDQTGGVRGSGLDDDDDEILMLN